MAQLIAQKTTVPEDLGLIPSNGFFEDGFSGKTASPFFLSFNPFKKILV
jgi:hypothetical protein